MLSRLLGTFLSLMITLAVGVCPCGLSSTVDRVAAALRPATPVVQSRCRACHSGGAQRTSRDGKSPDPRRCAATVTGELPSVPVALPVIYADLSFVPAVPVGLQAVGAVADPDGVLRPGLPPPPTLLNLSCCSNT